MYTILLVVESRKICKENIKEIRRQFDVGDSTENPSIDLEIMQHVHVLDKRPAYIRGWSSPSTWCDFATSRHSTSSSTRLGYPEMSSRLVAIDLSLLLLDLSLVKLKMR